jgi:hypothetical protein
MKINNMYYLCLVKVTQNKKLWSLQLHVCFVSYSVGFYYKTTFLNKNNPDSPEIDRHNDNTVANPGLHSAYGLLCH